MIQWKYDQFSPEQHQALDDLITDSKTMNEDDVRRILVSEHQIQEKEDEIPYVDQESRARVILAQLREVRQLPSEQPEKSRGEEHESVAEAKNIKIAARVAEMNKVECNRARKCLKTQAQGPQVNQNQLENSQRPPPELERRIELIKKNEATDILIESSMIKLLADFIQEEKGSFNPLKNRNRPDFEAELVKYKRMKQSV
ncbi:MAG: hypothetical protein EZS28_024388 [Streblomastix strix]|uniref:Uncharacterized protein n=1 Tax=Streblomastix strix TaxID=222440 RepID=A0A5J4VCB1_9EUKA|nr:MAG: hypothetical protein EZS28_024388 [Streblomastix strix]